MEGTEKQASDADYVLDLSKVGQETTEQETTEEQQEVVSEETVEETVEQTEEAPVAEAEEEQVVEQPVEKSREDMFNELLRDKYDIDTTELENVLTKKETQELPEDVKQYLQYKSETNRGLEDYLRLQQDFDALDNTTLLREFYRQTKNGLDDNDINSLLDLKFGYDEGAEESLIKSKTLEMKEELYKAKQFFEVQKEKYKRPLESSEVPLPDNVKKAVEFYQRYTEDQKSQSERQTRNRESFEKKTNQLFNEEFKGFEFKIGEEKIVFKPKDVSEMKNKQADLSNFIKEHTDADGNLIDAQKYHTALSMAMNPMAYAKFFYEQGKANAVNDVVAQGKNIDMNVRSSIDSSKPQPKFRVLQDNSTFGSGLKIKKR